MDDGRKGPRAIPKIMANCNITYDNGNTQNRKIELEHVNLRALRKAGLEDLLKSLRSELPRSRFFEVKFVYPETNSGILYLSEGQYDANVEVTFDNVLKIDGSYFKLEYYK